jgi:selenocysteine-specific elongation factor
MTPIVVGVVGHVDHGKTALVAALTGIDTDRLAEEKARGISIALGFAHFDSGGGTVDLIDMPGHERFIRTMIAGASGIDAALLVVAADEGVKPQTIEHVDIAGLIGVARAVVAVTKSDLAMPADARRVGEEAGAILADAGIAVAATVHTSATTGEGIGDLRAKLAGLTAGRRQPADDGVAFLPIDRAFTIAGHGAVATGTLRGAAIRRDDMLELLPERRRVRVRATHVHGAAVPVATPGQRVAVNLRDVAAADLARGMALASADALPASEWLTIALRTVATAPPLRNGRRLRALFGTAEAEVRLRLLDRDAIGPGETAPAQLRFAEPVAIPARASVVLRIASPVATVAGGRVIEPETRRLRRHDAAILDRLASLAALSPEAVIVDEVARRGLAGTTVAQLSRLTALSPARVAALLKAQPVMIDKAGAVASTRAVDAIAAAIPPLLAGRSDGLPPDRIRAALPGSGPAVVAMALARLQAAAAITRRGERIAILRPEADRARLSGEAALAARIAGHLRAGGLAPPNPADVAPDPAARQAIDRLLRDGTIVRAVDRAKHREMLFHAEAVQQARALLAPLLVREPGLLVTEICAALGISRRHAMPLLDHLDTIRFTRRAGDRRMLRTA